MEKEEIIQQLKADNPGKENLIDNLGKSGLFDLPQTDFTLTISVNSLEAKQFLATLEADLRIWQGMTSDTAKARVQITQQHLEMAKKLFKL